MLSSSLTRWLRRAVLGWVGSAVLSGVANCSAVCGGGADCGDGDGDGAIFNATEMFVVGAVVSALLAAALLCTLQARGVGCCSGRFSMPAPIHMAPTPVPRNRFVVGLQLAGMALLHRQLGTMSVALDGPSPLVAHAFQRRGAGGEPSTLTYLSDTVPLRLVPLVVFLPTLAAMNSAHRYGGLLGLVHSTICFGFFVPVVHTYFDTDGGIGAVTERRAWRYSEYPAEAVALVLVFAGVALWYACALLVTRRGLGRRTMAAASLRADPAGPLHGYAWAEDHVREVLLAKNIRGWQQLGGGGGGGAGPAEQAAPAPRLPSRAFRYAPRLVGAVAMAGVVLAGLSARYYFVMKHNVAEGFVFCVLSMNVNGTGVPPLGSGACDAGSCMHTLRGYAKRQTFCGMRATHPLLPLCFVLIG